MNQTDSPQPNDIEASRSMRGSTDHAPLAVKVPFVDDWYQVPTRIDTVWIARRSVLPWYEIMWLPYYETVRDLLRAGF
jgi:hypothetical protein